MANEKRISLKLSPEQQKQIKDATGKNAGALELTVQELEERIAPMTLDIGSATGGAGAGKTKF